MTSKVLRWGNSLGIRIPAALARRAGVGVGAVAEFQLVDGALVVTLRSAVTIVALLEGVTAENVHEVEGW